MSTETGLDIINIIYPILRWSLVATILFLAYWGYQLGKEKRRPFNWEQDSPIDPKN